MAATEPEVVEFDAADPGALLGHMHTLRQARAGWVNLEPEVVADDEPPPDRGLFSMFTRPPPRIPLATWAPGAMGRGGGAQPDQIGVQHPTGRRARQQLAGSGHPVPSGWRVLQDHVRRGLVVAVPPGIDDAEVVAWLLRACALLSSFPVTGKWRAAVYAP